MSYQVRPARRSEAKPIMGVYSQSGAGKTYSTLLLARGFVGPAGKIVMIETEQGRGEAYSDVNEYPEIGGYGVVPMRESFAPKEYFGALKAAERDKPDALIVDSASHEWEGVGGVLEMAAASGSKSVNAWTQPKFSHSHDFLLPLLQTPIPLVILNMRAKYPMIEVYNEEKRKKEWVRSKELEPIQAADILFEMFVHFWIEMDNHKVHITKCTNRALRELMRDGTPIDADTGKRLREWAAGRGTTRDAGAASPPPPSPPPPPTTAAEIYTFDAAGFPTTHKKWSEFIAALAALLETVASDTVAATRLWDKNESTFTRGLEGAKRSGNAEAIAAFNALGKRAAEVRHGGGKPENNL